MSIEDPFRDFHMGPDLLALLDKCGNNPQLALSRCERVDQLPNLLVIVGHDPDSVIRWCFNVAVEALQEASSKTPGVPFPAYTALRDWLENREQPKATLPDGWLDCVGDLGAASDFARAGQKGMVAAQCTHACERLAFVVAGLTYGEWSDPRYAAALKSLTPMLREQCDPG